LASGCKNYFFTERGTTFGYNNLVADMRSIPWMQELGAHARRDRFAVHGADQVAGFGFDLDHFRAVVGEDLGREWPHDDRSEVDDGDAFERAAGH
jgi:hypothetical protein